MSQRFNSVSQGAHAADQPFPSQFPSHLGGPLTTFITLFTLHMTFCSLAKACAAYAFRYVAAGGGEVQCRNVQIKSYHILSSGTDGIVPLSIAARG